MPHRSVLADVPTPAAVLDLDVLERNVAAMAAKARALGVALRPHAKTHKCVEVARLQKAHGTVGLTVAALPEARAFADAGFDDITWAVPVVPGRLDEVMALARRITFRVLVESDAAADALERAARDAALRLHVWLEVDSGQRRTGVAPDAAHAVPLAQRLAASPHLAFDGILTHAGQGYHAKDRAALLRAAAEERDVMTAFRDRVTGAGVAVPGVSIGSTPTMAVVTDLTGITEIRPGNYAFNDYVQAANGVCGVADCALTVLASVISHQPGADHAVVDAGALALSKDLGPGDPARRRGYGPLLLGLVGRELEPALRVTGVTQEHGIVAGEGPADVDGRVAVGEKVRILANHSCLTAAMFDAYVVVRGEEVVDRWRIWRGR